MRPVLTQGHNYCEFHTPKQNNRMNKLASIIMVEAIFIYFVYKISTFLSKFAEKPFQFKTDMNTIELKNNFHLLIDRIENESILSKFYTIMDRANKNKDGELWKNLSPEDKEELLLSYSESEDDKQLISHTEVKKKYKKWL